MQARQPPNIPVSKVVARSISGTYSCTYSTNVEIVTIIKYFASGLSSYTVGFGKAFPSGTVKPRPYLLLICFFSFLFFFYSELTSIHLFWEWSGQFD